MPTCNLVETIHHTWNCKHFNMFQKKNCESYSMYESYLNQVDDFMLLFFNVIKLGFYLIEVLACSLLTRCL
jgi:hypothetical protein